MLSDILNSSLFISTSSSRILIVPPCTLSWCDVVPWRRWHSAVQSSSTCWRDQQSEREVNPVSSRRCGVPRPSTCECASTPSRYALSTTTAPPFHISGFLLVVGQVRHSFSKADQQISPIQGLTVNSLQLTFLPTSQSCDTKTRPNIKNPVWSNLDSVP